MIRRLRRTIHDLRQQPEEVRLRAATYLTVVAGAALSLLWLFVLLPLQLYFNRPTPSTPVFQQPQAAADPAGAVSGVRQINPPAAEPIQELHGTRPSVRKFIPSSTAPTPSPTPADEDALPVEEPVVVDEAPADPGQPISE